MSNDAGLVASLVERLTTRLPHLTGSPVTSELNHDDHVASVTRASIVNLSATSIASILDSLISRLEEVARFYSFASHPHYVRQSEIYLVSLAADCCSVHWGSVQKSAPNASSVAPSSRLVPPKPLDDSLAKRILGHIRHLLEPIPDGYVIPAKAILEDDYVRKILEPRYDEPARSLASSNSSDTTRDTNSSRGRNEEAEDVEQHIKVIVEFVSAANWSVSFDYVRYALYSKRTTTPAHANSAQSMSLSEEDRTLLVIIKLLGYLWVDTQKLGLIMQDLSATFLHFRRVYQNTVALVVPVLIVKWIERCPREFARLHSQRRKLDGGPDALADMAHSLGDNGRRRSSLYPFQTTLLMLVPEVFEVAGNSRGTKGGNMGKRVAFLEGLRKGLRNKNETAGVCLVILVRAARHFISESETAFSSFVMGIQDELRDAVFRRHHLVGDGILFEQDLTTAALISLIQIKPDVYVDTLVQVCAQSSAPLSFQVAIMQTCSYFARKQNPQDYRRLYIAVAGFVRHQLKALSAASANLYLGVRPARRKGSLVDANTTNEIVICHTLNFLAASPLSLFENVSSDAQNLDSLYEEVYKSFVSCLVTSNDTVRFLSTPLALSILPTNGILSSVRRATPLDSEDFKLEFWQLTSSVLLDMCVKYRQQEDVSVLKSIYKYLQTGLILLSACRELCNLIEDPTERQTVSLNVESTLLVALCAPELEICQLVTASLGLYNDECLILLEESEEAKVATLQLPNYDVFAEIASREFRFTGLMAFQKRTRALLRRITSPGPGILEAWERAFNKWNHLSNDLSITYNKDDKLFVEWRNLTGFLASLGGVCTAEQAYGMLEEPMSSGMKWIDRVVSEDSGTPILHVYLQRSTALLSSSNGLVRETIRDALSTEISPTLYLPLFKSLESELTRIFDEARDSSGRGQDKHIIFATEAASLLRNLVDKLETASDFSAAAAVNFSALGLEFVKFLDGAADTPATLRVKTKFCQLYESITKKKEHLNFRDDVRKRNLLLEFIFDWIARPRSPKSDGTHGMTRQDEDAVEAQKDLDKACFRCLASLTYRLPLQPGEGQSDAGTSELKSQMFHTYFNRFLSLLDLESAEKAGRDASTIDETGSTSALAITILSNLLSSNIDVGLKHSLSIGYHENIEIRTAFIKVLYNILVQGTEFSTLSDKAINERYGTLAELLTQDMSLVVAISAACPSSEVEELTVSLLNVFESRGLTFELMDALIKQEIADTENAAEVLRRNCVTTKMLSIYAKWKGAYYLKNTLQKVLEKLTSHDLDLELDPSRLSSREELEKHTEQLQIVAKVFVDAICGSAKHIPPSFRRICNTISITSENKFKDTKCTSVGAFVFLRFFCPAIVSPESEKLVTEPPSKELRRGLLLVAKIIQTLANNFPFGAKEPYMTPLNDFLLRNISDVTAFLIKISELPPNLDVSQPDRESFDFGSCVVLHRFLYEHWDNVRRRLIQEKKGQKRTPDELARGRGPSDELLRALINALGPPSLAISWNRPQVLTNHFNTYSRFQQFMLRNAFRDTSSYLGNGMIYDGGETKDGLSLICIVLRHIDQETTDPDTLLFAYLKLASRLWHKPFGVLIDATCDNLSTDYHNDMMAKLELLAPAEAITSQSRLYIYNMNSTYRKTLRRNLRLFSKLFERSNTDIYLLGSNYDLQTHFNHSEIPLPKDTLDIGADVRYNFQSVTRLSKTKGKIEVAIRIGSQFLQVTTVRKQEVHPGHGLSAILNDIFRLNEVDEAPTCILPEEDSAFGLRADNGKIVMIFQSPRKNEILQAIRNAKAKYGKDTRTMKSIERFIRPQDIPGTLLNLALINLAAPDQTLRIASYNLLGALCQAFKFKAASKFVCINDMHIPLDPNQFIVNMSKTLAQEEPQLTADFLNEFFLGWENFTDEQKPLSLAYMAPWLLSLRSAFLGHESDCDVGKERIAAIFQKLLDVTATDASLYLILEQTVWPAIYKDETLLDIFLEVIIKAAIAVGPSDEYIQALTSIVIAIGTITLRGRVISRLRKALNRSVVRPTRYLPENAVWDEICILLQFCLALSFDCGVQSQLYMPEIFHVVTILANCGQVDIRSAVQRLLVNSLHAACTSFKLDDERSVKLRSILDKISDPKSDTLFIPANMLREGTGMNTMHDGAQALAATEQLAILLFDTCTVAAPSVDLTNAWRSRWMSLVASTAFQNNPAIQPRAFTVMGCLAQEEIDDDLLYQVLVALRHSITRFGEDGSTDMLTAVVTALSKMIVKLTSTSRYALQLFWLAISLIRLMPNLRLFNCATLFLEAVLTNIGVSNELRNDKFVSLLLQGRSTLEKATLPLDDILGIHFTPDNFHFAVCACLVRGLTDVVTKAITLRVLSTFLELTSSSLPNDVLQETPELVYRFPYMSLIMSRLAEPEQVLECLWLANVNPIILANQKLDRNIKYTAQVTDKDLLLHTAIQLVDFRNLETDLQTHQLMWLKRLSTERPAVVVHLYSSIISLLNKVLVQAQNKATLNAAHELLETLITNPKLAAARERPDTLIVFLEDMGFEGLWRTTSFSQAPEFDKQLIGLMERLIELIII